jgi:hypothetical protein
VLCPNFFSSLLIGEELSTIQATEQVAVDYGGGLIRVRREGAGIIVAPYEVGLLVTRRHQSSTANLWASL